MAEIEKKRTDDKQKKSQLTEEERAAKLARLQQLQAKLHRLQTGDSQTQSKETFATNMTNGANGANGANAADISKGSGTVLEKQKAGLETQTSAHLDDLEQELTKLEQETLSEFSNLPAAQKLADNSLIEDIDKKISALSKIDSEANLSQSELADIDNELQLLEKQISLEQQKAAITVSIFDKLCEEHDWLNQERFEFMYTMPHKKKQKNEFVSWLDDWSRVLYDYARIAVAHVVYFKQLMSEKPWADLKDRTNALYEISDDLVKKKVALWLDKKKEKLRIYWKSIEEWADIISDWALQNVITEPILIGDIREAGQDFSNLPEDDLLKIFNLIAKSGKAEKFKLSNGSVALKFKY